MKAIGTFSILRTALLTALFTSAIALASSLAQADTHVKSESNAPAHSHSLDSKMSDGEGESLEVKLPQAPLPRMKRTTSPDGPEIRSNLIRGI